MASLLNQMTVEAFFGRVKIGLCPIPVLILVVRFVCSKPAVDRGMSSKVTALAKQNLDN